MLPRLKGKIAIVTGGDSGIGRAAAIMFAREGCTGITIAHLPEEHQDAKGVQKTLEQEGAKVNLFSGDLMQEEDCKALVDDHLQKFGKLNILVNNASKQMHDIHSTLRSVVLTLCRLEYARSSRKLTWATFKALSIPISSKCSP